MYRVREMMCAFDDFDFSCWEDCIVAAGRMFTWTGCAGNKGDVSTLFTFRASWIESCIFAIKGTSVGTAVIGAAIFGEEEGGESLEENDLALSGFEGNVGKSCWEAVLSELIDVDCLSSGGEGNLGADWFAFLTFWIGVLPWNKALFSAGWGFVDDPFVDDLEWDFFFVIVFLEYDVFEHQ